MGHGLEAHGPIDLGIEAHRQHAAGLLAAHAQGQEFLVVGHGPAAALQESLHGPGVILFVDGALAALLVHLGLAAEDLGHEELVLRELHVPAADLVELRADAVLHPLPEHEDGRLHVQRQGRVPEGRGVLMGRQVVHQLGVALVEALLDLAEGDPRRVYHGQIRPHMVDEAHKAFVKNLDLGLGHGDSVLPVSPRPGRMEGSTLRWIPGDRMKFFIDTANIDEIKRINALGVLDGVTTNPSLIAKETGKPFEQIIEEICGIVDGPISAEVIGLEAPGMIEEGRRLSKIHKNVVVKLPLIAEGLKACKALSAEGIRTNVTLCFSATQALMAAKAGATYVSPFVGRLDDINLDGMELIREICAIFENYDFETQCLAASIRSPRHVTDSALAGAHVATIPTKVFDQMLKHPLTDKGVEGFLADWKKSGR